MHRPSRPLSVLLAVLALGAGATGCGSGDDEPTAGPDGITLYNAQHEDLMVELTEAFTKETGIEVALRNGSDLELANQLVQEGDRSPADVFVTENSPAMQLVDGRELFAPVASATVGQVPARYRPEDRSWVGFAARQTVFVYNPTKPAGQALPSSIMDLADPRWKGRFGYSPTGADFQAVVSAVLALEGPERTKAWLAGLKANAVAFKGNIKVMSAVNKGEIEGGIIYHYYWYQDQAEAGEDSKNTKLHVFAPKDPGAFTSVSGAGILKSTDNPEGAQRLLAFLTGKVGQGLLARSSALEYPVASGVAANPALRPLKEIGAPVVDPDELNSREVVTMMQDVGIL